MRSTTTGNDDDGGVDVVFVVVIVVVFDRGVSREPGGKERRREGARLGVGCGRSQRRGVGVGVVGVGGFGVGGFGGETGERDGRGRVVGSAVAEREREKARREDEVVENANGGRRREPRHEG